MSVYFNSPSSLGNFNFQPVPNAPTSPTFTADSFTTPVTEPLYLSGARALGEPQQPSPIQPGAETQAAQPGWGENWAKFLGGIGKLGAGLGAGVAAARGDMPMAGQLLSSYFEDKTGDTSGDSLAKALKTLQDAGLISAFTLDTGDDTTKVV
jgi:hypothetical protein